MARKDRTGNRKTREQQKQTSPPDEEKALQTAARKYEQCLREGKSIPSQMCHATTVHDFQPFALFIPSTQLHKITIVSKFTWICVRHPSVLPEYPYSSNPPIQSPPLAALPPGSSRRAG